MALQNRVDPWGQLIAVKARGQWLGNRGILHNEHKKIIVPWRHKSWVTCKLEFKGISRPIFSPNSYSELFFLDEATAFSAGHRPCAECRRQRYNEFKDAWLEVNSDMSSITVSKIDKQLHCERAKRGGIKVTHSRELRAVPSGAFIEIEGNAYLFWQGALKRWSPEGYLETVAAPGLSEKINVLTPSSICNILATGFSPQVHESCF